MRRFKADPTHGYAHAEETLKNAERIAKTEKLSGGELEQLRIAAFFHDVGNIHLFTTKNYDHNLREMHEENGAEMLAELLKRIGEDPGEYAEATAAISRHDSGPHETLLEKILSDADKLCSLGGSGIIRSIDYGEKVIKTRPFYTPGLALEERLRWLPGQKRRKTGVGEDTLTPILYIIYRRGDPRAYYTDEGKRMLAEKTGEAFAELEKQARQRNPEQAEEIMSITREYAEAVKNEPDDEFFV